jgi:tetratricopeptide (TPR) repeat protein
VTAAEALLERATADPVAVRAEAAVLLARALADGDDAVAAVAAHALGLAEREADDVPAAVVHLRQAVELAERAGLPDRAAVARLSLAPAVAFAGDTDAALAELDRAAASLEEPGRSRARVQRAGILQMAGRFDEALAEYGGALPVLRRWGDRMWEARARNNRGLIHLHRCEWAPAAADLEAARRLFAVEGCDVVVAELDHNLGLLAARRGDVPEALARYDAAEARLRELGLPGGIGLLARAETLLAVRLVSDARAAAERAVTMLEAAGLATEAAQARLLVAQAALLDGDPPGAEASAEAARRAFVAQARPGWAALAGHAAVAAAWAAGDRSEEAQRRAAAVADELAAVGWAVAALDARLMAARIALECGRVDSAIAHLAAVRAAGRSGRADLRARAWHATALVRVASGDRAGALAAVRAGLAALDRQRATLGATELRAAVAGHGAELAALGLRLALSTGRPRQVLGWAERCRAAALRQPPALPPSDEAMAADLATLRAATAAVEDAVLAGDDPGPLLRRQASLEGAVRRRALQARGAVPAGGTVAVGDVVAGLGEAALVELVEVDGALMAVVVAGRRASLHDLGPADAVRDVASRLPAALRRLATGRGTAASLAAAATAARHAGAALDGLLLRPLAGRLGDRPLVVVPTGDLHALPWALLPSCAGRPVTVAPSAAAWWRAACLAGGRGAGREVLVAGPRLHHADGEVADLAAVYRGAVVLQGPAATASAVAAVLDGAAMAHVASHARFRADNPLFSCLDLADGPLTVYDLERLRRAPAVLVLSACESGRSAVRPGDELMGLAAAVLALGTATLVASVVPVPDAATRPLMVDLHTRLRAGTRPAEALALAQQAALADADGPALAASAGFACFGAG